METINIADDWVDVLEDVPQLAPNCKNVSIEVKLWLNNNRIVDAFYAYAQDRWYYSNNGNMIPNKLPRWWSSF